MTVAEELRKHADLAIKEGGMYYSGEYLDAIARRAESEQAENAKLRELVVAQCECVKHDDCNECAHYSEGKCMFPFKSMYRELGIEA